MIKHIFFIFISVIYLMNFTMGVYELPDNLPFIGNLDEFAASSLLIYSLGAIRKRRAEKKEAKEAKPVEPLSTETID